MADEPYAEEIERLQRLMQALRAATSLPDWPTTPGEHTLPRMLGVERREVANCSVVAWLLHPDAPHGIGKQLSSWLIDRVASVTDAGGPIKVSTERSRYPTDPRLSHYLTRADIVLQSPDTTLVIEAKIDHVEEPDQARRLESAWTEPNVHFGYLTVDGREPDTCNDPTKWSTITWEQIAAAARERLPAPTAADDDHAVAVRTAYAWIDGITRSLTNVTQQDELDAAQIFYLEHAADIERLGQLGGDIDRTIGDVLTRQLSGSLTEVGESYGLRYHQFRTGFRWVDLLLVPGDTRPGTSPVVSIGVGTDLLGIARTAQPWVGVRTDYRVPAGRFILDGLRQLPAVADARRLGFDDNNDYWPLCKLMPAPDSWWEDPAGWATAMAAATGELADLVWEDILRLQPTEGRNG